MNLLVAIDSFKGSASSKQMNEALLESINNPAIREKISVPIADGGEGTLESLYEANGGEKQAAVVQDLMGKPVEVTYLVTYVEGKKTAIIESASVVGIDKIIPSEQTIMRASSYGLGQLLLSIVEINVEVIYLTLGGSGTSDGGLGLLAGLGGIEVSDLQQNPLYTFRQINLENAREKLKNIKLIALADVTNPYIGEMGFSKVFGPQKGGSSATLETMDEIASIVAAELTEQSGIDIADAIGAGAAGGLGGVILALGGSIESGFTAISQMIGLEEKIKKADLIITGEGRIDSQTENGKVPFGLAQLAKKHNKPILAICGTRSQEIGTMEELLMGGFSIHLGPITLEEAMNHEVTISSLKITGQQLVNLYIKGREAHGQGNCS